MHPVANLEGLLCSFSPGGDSLAIATPDGKIKLYDSSNGRLRVTLSQQQSAGSSTSLANGHLTENFTSLVWTHNSKDKLLGKSISKQVKGIAVGTAHGFIKFFDNQLGELKWISKDTIEGGVASIAYSQNSAGTIYAASASGNVVVLNAINGSIVSKFQASKHPLSCIATTPDYTGLLIGASSLSLWDSESQERVRKFAGHTTNIKHVCVTPDGNYAVSAASGDRVAAVWSTSTSLTSTTKKHKKTQVAVASLALDAPPAQMDACSSASGETYYVAAVSLDGEAYVWELTPQEGGSVQVRHLAKVKAASNAGSSSSQDCILAVRLVPSTEGPKLMLCRGSSARPAFETVNIPSANSASAAAATIALAPLAVGVLKQPSQPAIRAAADAHATATVLGPENVGQPILMQVVGSGVKRSVEEVAEMERGIRMELAEPGVPQSAEDELPLGERVKALEERLGISAAADHAQAGPSGSNAAGASMAPHQSADSLAVLLTQAVRSNDKKLLETVLLPGTPEKVVKSTVRRLPPHDAAEFLRCTAERLSARPGRAAALAPWIQSLLLYHAAYLMAAPSTAAIMTSLYQTIEARLAMHRQLLSLSGRLNLLMAQVGQQGEDDEKLDQPEIVYEESDEEGVIVEDPFQAGTIGSDDDDEGASDEDEDEGEEDSDDMADDMAVDGADDDDDEDDEDDDL